MLKYLPAIVAISLLAGCAKAPVPVEQQFIDDAAAALGGKSNIEAVSTLTIEGQGHMLNLGQDLTPESVTMRFEISGYELAVDLANGSSRTELTRTPQFTYFRGPDPMRLVFGIDGGIAYNIGADGSAQRAPENMARERRSTYYHHPLPLLQAALLGTATTSNVRDEDGHTLADFKTSDGKSLTMAVDATTKLPVYIRSADHHSYLRDVTRQTNFSQYEEVGGINLPSELSQTLDEFSVFNLRLTAHNINAAVGDLSAPPEAASAEPISGASPANVTAEEVADGVWFLAGQSHHSVLIEFSDHLMVVEAPNETRTLAVLAKAAELVPDKPVTQLVNTHHHFDHSAGIRAAVSEGLTIVTQAANEAFYRRMAEQPSTIVPDALAHKPQAIKIEVVEDVRSYADDSMAVELYHIAGNPHSDSMLMAYLPEHRLIIEADAFTPSPGRAQLFSPNLLENIQRHGLEIDRIVPIHGGVGDFAELESHVQGLPNQR